MPAVRHTLAGIALAALFALSATAQKLSAPCTSKRAIALKPQHVSDAIRGVVLADREVYTRVTSTHQEGSVGVRASLPSPCEILRLGAQAAGSKGVGYSYVLRSLQPLNNRNAPETEIETKGLQFVRTRPDLVYSSDELLGGRWYFTAVYPDVAVSESCLGCHNRRIGNEGKRFELGDVIGALVVRIPLQL